MTITPIINKKTKIFDRISELFLDWARGAYPDEEFNDVVQNDTNLSTLQWEYKNIHEFYEIPYHGPLTVDDWNSRGVGYVSDLLYPVEANVRRLNSLYGDNFLQLPMPRRSKRLQNLNLLHHDN